MTHDFNLDGLGDHFPALENTDDWSRLFDVPLHLELVDGRELLVLGDHERCAEFNHKQGVKRPRVQ